MLMKSAIINCSLVVALIAGTIDAEPARSQSVVPASVVPASDGTGTSVTANGNQFNISGGKLSRDGANLFQSFTQFGLSSQQSANFLSSATIRNILARVTSGDASIINGLIKITGGNSNLLLMNPAGIVFGANARLDVPAAFTATTATSIGFGDKWFNASGSNDYAALVGTPSSFAFNTSHPGAIVNAGVLAVGQGQNLTLLAGTVVSSGQLSAPGGQVTIAAIPGQKLVRVSQSGHLLSLDIQPLSAASSQPAQWTQPVASLPQLLTGAGGENATGVKVNSDGTVELIGSGLKVNADTGVLIATGTLNDPSTDAKVLGASITAGDIQAKNIEMSASSGKGDITTGNISSNGNVDLEAINDVKIGSLTDSFSTTGSSESVKLVADSNNNGQGSFSMAPLATIDTGRRDLKILGAGIKTGDITAGKVELTAHNGDLTTTSINSVAQGRGQVTLSSTNGNVTVGNIFSKGGSNNQNGTSSGTDVRLTAKAGTIQLIGVGVANDLKDGYIQAGDFNSDSDSTIAIESASFRAINPRLINLTNARGGNYNDKNGDFIKYPLSLYAYPKAVNQNEVRNGRIQLQFGSGSPKYIGSSGNTLVTIHLLKDTSFAIGGKNQTFIIKGKKYPGQFDRNLPGSGTEGLIGIGTGPQPDTLMFPPQNWNGNVPPVDPDPNDPVDPIDPANP